MKERPIIFSGEMVKAILEGRKTQTRRVMKPQPVLKKGFYEWAKGGWSESVERIKPLMPSHSISNRCPYGTIRDRLWVRETWAHDDPDCKDIGCGNRDHIWWKASEEKIVADSFAGDAHWRPSIHMPRWASRIILEITDVWIERLWKITNDDVLAEGIKQTKDGSYLAPLAGVDGFPWQHAVPAFASLWNDINDKRGYGWDVNPWVWVIEFRRLNAD